MSFFCCTFAAKNRNYMKRKLILSLMLGTMTLVASAGKYVNGSVTVNGKKRTYIAYEPTKLDSMPAMLISCHGMNQDANYQKGMLSIDATANNGHFLTVFPQGEGNSWDISGDKDINFMKVLIDQMVKKYNVDRNRVYLSGFSMGGMFTYHAMNKIPDRIAAFAPISGYPMWGTTADSKVRPIPIIHTHGTGDDVVNFGGVQGALNVWIKHNGCPTTAKVEKKYRGAPHITRHTWGPGKDGVEVVLMELADKGHWISNDYGVYTGEEIWKFCKKYSLDMKDPSVQITAPTTGLSFITFGATSDVPPVTVTATASDSDGRIVSVSFYDGETLLKKVTKAPYSYEVKGLKKGEHAIRAVATDNDGRTATAEVTINVAEPTGTYLMHKTFTVEGSVPEGWTTFDGVEKRTGLSSDYSQGSRLFHLTGEKHDFEWGLYTRNVDGKTREGYARFGDEGTSVTLTLGPGKYRIMTRVANWNQSDFSPVTVAVETTDGREAWAGTFTPTANVGNGAGNSFSGTSLETLNFEINEKARYYVTFYTADAPWADLLIGQAAIQRTGNATGIDSPETASVSSVRYYTLSGQPVESPKSGLYIRQQTTASGKTVSKKVVVK